MGNASTQFDTRKFFEDRHSRDGCRTFILLPNSASSSCWGKIHLEDPSLGVSFLLFLFILTVHLTYIRNLLNLILMNIFHFSGRIYRYLNCHSLKLYFSINLWRISQFPITDQCVCVPVCQGRSKF